MALVLIDVDGTLLIRKNSELVFGLDLLRQGILGKNQIYSYFEFYLKWIKFYGRTVVKKNKAYLCGLNQDAVAALAERYVQKRLHRLVRLNLYERIKNHIRLGHQTVLLTGTLDCIARPLAEHMGITCVLASQCATRNGRFTADPPLVHPYGFEKLQVAKDLATLFNTSLSDCIAYADSRADLPLLMAVSHPVVVAPDRHLARVAWRNGWEILSL